MKTPPVTVGTTGVALGKEEFPISRADAAAFLRELADQLEKSDTIEVNTGQRRIQLAAHEPLNLEIDYNEDTKKKKLEVELEIKEYFGRAAASGAARPTAGPR